jgi:SnoaL-like domain/Uncharacterized protein conserved in bacteria (DUF2188)
VDAAQIVREALAAARAGDIETLVSRCSANCDLRFPEGAVHGRAALRRTLRAGRSRAPSYEAGEPEHVGGGHVLVLLTMPWRIGTRTVDIEATAIWKVEEGLIVSLRAVAGGKRDALVELGLVDNEVRHPSIDAIHTLYRHGVWVNETSIEGRLSRHRTRAPATQAGRKLAIERATDHVVHRMNGSISIWHSYRRDTRERAAVHGAT